MEEGSPVPPPLPIPADVQLWLLDVFRGCNERVSGIVSTMPNAWETSLDMSFIESFHSVSAPHLFPSGWTVDLSTHYLGSGRHWPEWEPWPRRWEIADIGFLVQFRQSGKLVCSKVALLQSKRLYPDELVYTNEDITIDYWRGFSRLFERDDEWADVIAPRPFTFTEQSRSRTLIAGNDQYRAIAGYEQQRQVPVYYMLYNPLAVPSTTVPPLRPTTSPPMHATLGVESCLLASCKP